MIDSTAQRLFDANVRVDEMFWIAGICASPPSEFSDFLEDYLPDCEDILTEHPWLKSDGIWDAEELMGEFAMRNIDGFFIKVATPKPRNFFDGGYESSWGVTRIKWMFCRDLNDIADKAIEWQKSVLAAERAKNAALPAPVSE